MQTYAPILLRNAADIEKAREGFIREDQIREVSVNALADTGAGTLVINEEIWKHLGLGVIGLRRVSLGNNVKETCQLSSPVHITWKNRTTACPAIVISGDGGVLLGAVPLGDMDLVVHPGTQELVGAHGDDVVCLVM
ncbi:hypothetical protein FACS1894200_13400 [Spirochaetia bacterium]|nr:hypothetical protein FACS1894200_13400 [Spirochaetia bacterium]